ncbi:2Fe-2S iron-sulfur cluster-binding protein [Colwelliaceae bacterium BS250]
MTKTITIHFIEPNGTTKTVTAETGLSIMVAAVENNITGIPAICNGCCSCGTCLIELPQDKLHLASQQYSGEIQVLLKLKNATDNSRLACQVVVSDELEGVTFNVTNRL